MVKFPEVKRMSSNCGKCGAKLGIYEYNLSDTTVVCDSCVEGRVPSKNSLPEPEDDSLKVVKGFDQLKSTESVPSNVLITVFWASLILIVLALIFVLYDGQLTIRSFSVLFVLFTYLLFFSRFRGRESYRVSDHNLIIRSASDQSERVVDLRTIYQYNIYCIRYMYQLVLYTRSGEMITVDAGYIKNYKEVFTCIKQNLDTINAGKYMTKDPTPLGMTTFVDPENVGADK